MARTSLVSDAHWPSGSSLAEQPKAPRNFTILTSFAVAQLPCDPCEASRYCICNTGTPGRWLADLLDCQHRHRASPSRAEARPYLCAPEQHGHVRRRRQLWKGLGRRSCTKGGSSVLRSSGRKEATIPVELAYLESSVTVYRIFYAAVRLTHLFAKGPAAWAASNTCESTGEYAKPGTTVLLTPSSSHSTPPASHLSARQRGAWSETRPARVRCQKRLQIIWQRGLLKRACRC